MIEFEQEDEDQKAVAVYEQLQFDWVVGKMRRDYAEWGLGWADKDGEG